MAATGLVGHKAAYRTQRLVSPWDATRLYQSVCIAPNIVLCVHERVWQAASSQAFGDFHSDAMSEPVMPGVMVLNLVPASGYVWAPNGIKAVSLGIWHVSGALSSFFGVSSLDQAVLACINSMQRKTALVASGNRFSRLSLRSPRSPETFAQRNANANANANAMHGRRWRKSLATLATHHWTHQWRKCLPPTVVTFFCCF